MRVLTGVMMLALVTFVASPGYAQTAVGGGIKAGVNFADLSLEEDGFSPEFDKRIGGVIGGFVDVGITDRLSFQPEFLFTQKGAKFFDPEISGGTVEAKLTLNMIQIPVLLKANFGADAAVRGFIVVGPGFGFRTTAKIEVEDEDFEQDIKDDVESVEVSGIIGAGVQFGRGMIEVRYDHGFNDLDKDSAAEAKTRTISILFGVGFGR